MDKDRFKFRVWDKERKCFFNDDEVVIYPSGEESFFNADYDFTECVVEQCTGLRDKNGNLIYEGDIVRCSYGSEYYVGCVVWDYKEIQFSMEVDGELYSFSQYSDSHKTEIIGNIHENPDLIKS